MKNNRKGFTLAELLIVVAIIAVLVAIAIPVFTTQLEKAKEATDLANIRSKYAELVISVLDGSQTTASDTVTLTQGQPGWQMSPAPSGVAGVAFTGSPSANGSCAISIDGSGTASLTLS